MLNKQYALLSQLRLLTRVYGMYNRYVFIRECMPICTNSPKVTITFRKVQSDVNLLYSN